MKHAHRDIHYSYNADQPITDPAHDQYSRAKFAVGIARVVAGLPMGECFVLGLHGPWGDGKTSVLRFVERELRKSKNAAPVWFNPWRIGGADGLLFELFHTLASAGKIAMDSKFKQATRAIVKYAKILKPLGPLATFAASTMAFGVSAAIDGPAVVDATADWAKQFRGPTVEQEHDKLCQELLKLDRMIVVFVDDIDRLAAAEIVTLFRLIKACADLPNIIYILAFDRELVARVLGDRLAEGGADAGRRYLEKIIQIPLCLPPASRRDLDNVCIHGIQETLKSAGLALSDSEAIRWQWAYQDGISRRLRTPRQIAQYLNALRFGVPLLADEVNTVDLLMVEALRVCYPAAYEIIRANQEIFIGVPIGDLERRQVGSLQDDLLAPAKEQLTSAEAAGMERLVESMFPRYHVSRRGLALGHDSTKQWTLERRACSPAYGPRYFAYAIGSSDVADTDINAIIAAAAGPHATQLWTLLNKQMEPLKQVMLMLKLDARCLGLADNAAARLAVALATLCNRFEEPFSLQDSNHPGIAAARLAVRLCRQIRDLETRAQTAQLILEESAQPWFAAAFIKEVDPAFPRTTKEGVLTRASDLPKLRKSFLAIYNELDRSGTSLLDLERRWKFEMLFSVARAGGRQITHERFVDRMRSDGDIAIQILQCLVQPLARSGEFIPTPGNLSLDDFESLALIVDVDKMAQIVIENFVSEHRRKGPEAWDKMKPGDRILAQFWYYYELKTKNEARASTRVMKQAN